MSAESKRNMNPRSEPFLVKTGQRWKMFAGMIVLPLAIASWGYFAFENNNDQLDSKFLIHLGILAGAAVITVLLLRSVRCPRCGARLLIQAMRDPGGLNSFDSLMRSPACPFCKYNPEKATKPND